jgi:hypothetical protein
MAWRLIKGKLKLSLCFKWAPRHEGVLVEWSILGILVAYKHIFKIESDNKLADFDKFAVYNFRSSRDSNKPDSYCNG